MRLIKELMLKLQSEWLWQFQTPTLAGFMNCYLYDNFINQRLQMKAVRSQKVSEYSKATILLAFNPTPRWTASLGRETRFEMVTPNHLFLDSVKNIGPLISRWEINKF
jgi:hypothetical protein